MSYLIVNSLFLFFMSDAKLHILNVLRETLNHIDRRFSTYMYLTAFSIMVVLLCATTIRVPLFLALSMLPVCALLPVSFSLYRLSS